MQCWLNDLHKAH